MKRSGNGTSLPQWWYLKIFVPQIWRCKHGITGHLEKRRKDISDKMPGVARTVFAVWIPFAWQIEQAMHWVLSPLRINFRNSGRECYFILAAIPVFVVQLLLFALFYLVLPSVVIFGILYIGLVGGV